MSEDKLIVLFDQSDGLSATGTQLLKRFEAIICSIFSKDNDIEIIRAAEKQTPDVLIVLVDHEDIVSTDAKEYEKSYYCKLADKLIAHAESMPLIPIISVSLPIMRIEKQITKGDVYYDAISINGETQPLKSDDRLNTLDSNICCYYTHIGDTRLDLKQRLGKIFIQILSLKKNNLNVYQLPVAKEFIELYSRLIINNYLKDSDDAHATFVIPFPFHSEQIQQEKAMTKFDQIKKQYGGACWKILLIDDKKWKKDIIEQHLKKLGFTVLGDEFSYAFGQEKLIKPENLYVQISHATSIQQDPGKDAKSLIAESSFDLILLDYLLGEKKGLFQREYGSDIFKILDEGRFSKIPHAKRGPYDNFWVMSISSFHQTFLEKIKSTNSLFDDNWMLSRGGDPLNTPSLFKHELLNFLQFQLQKIGLDDYLLANFWFDAIDELSVLLKVNEKKTSIPGKSKLDYETLQNTVPIWANHNLYFLQQIWTRFDNYKKNFEWSFLIKSLIQRNTVLENDLEILYKSLRHFFDVLGNEDSRNYYKAEAALIDIYTHYNEAQLDSMHHKLPFKVYRDCITQLQLFQLEHEN